MIDIKKLLENSSDSLSLKKHLEEFSNYYKVRKEFIDESKNLIVENYYKGNFSYKFQIVYLILVKRNNIDL